MSPEETAIFFQQTLQALNQKMDTLIKDKVDVQYYRDRHEELERRMDKIEGRVDTIDEKINGLHNTSMAWVNDALSDQTAALNASTRELERRIFDKIEERSAFSRSQLIMIIAASVGWLLSIGGLLVAIFKH
jgi:tetrahydromethanopterin S-methyltransferase subunit G